MKKAAIHDALKMLVEAIADDDQPRGLWTKTQVTEYLACDAKTLDTMRAESDFPKPFLLANRSRMLRWCAHEVEAWARSHRANY